MYVSKTLSGTMASICDYM
ncbi:hypothetical protein F383_35882 [Gossypium arboreum]|uniref:Uncharacterized protein n=1 Tax=Gossypium arboreum TaxID=29729 RepID=A0A0B0N9D5_GOSAR|nr:hypothetical protein F383_35882 [Gossypium arboreum]